jgi:hypothetical protein
MSYQIVNQMLQLFSLILAAPGCRSRGSANAVAGCRFHEGNVAAVADTPLLFSE